ncbi:MAG: YgjV family protein [Clostridia bacterium]|nr:YgjV family protein [Clostridia bacterium]
MEPRFWIATGIGVLGMIACIMIFQQTERKKMLIWKMIADSLWLIQYVLLGAYGGVGTTAIAVLRGAVFLKWDPRQKGGKPVLIAFLIVSVAVGLLTWKNAFNLFSMAASVIAIVSFWIGNPKLSRILAFPISTSMLIYDVAYLSVMGIFNESFSMISSLIGIIRHDAKKNSASKESEA